MNEFMESLWVATTCEDVLKNAYYINKKILHVFITCISKPFQTLHFKTSLC